MLTITKEQTSAYVRALAALAEAIRDLGEIPEGELYARLMGYLDLNGFTRLIDRLIGAKLVERTPAHLLRWIGPKP